MVGNTFLIFYLRLNSNNLHIRPSVQSGDHQSRYMNNSVKFCLGEIDSCLGAQTSEGGPGQGGNSTY